MALSETANASIKQLIHELKTSLQAEEQAALRTQPRGGATIIRVLAIYEEHLRKIADRCASQCAWYYKNHPIDRTWVSGKKWQGDLSNYVKEYYEFVGARLNGIVSQVNGPASTLNEAQRRLDVIHTNVQERLWLNVEAQVGEGRSTSQKWVIGVGKYLVVAAFGYGVAVAQGLTTEYFKPLVTKPSNCQSSSPATASSQGKTPQASGTAHQLAPPYGGSSPALHPGLATPSSTQSPSPVHPGGHHA